MQKMAYSLSFLMGYPQHRDYYLYHTKVKFPVWPVFLLAAGVSVAAVCLFFQLTDPEGFSSGFFLETKVFSVFCIGSAVAAFVGKKLQIRRQSKKWYRQKQLGKRKTEIRFYKNFFTAHYPTIAFDGSYEDICKIDRTRHLVILLLKNGMEMPIPSEVYVQQLEKFLAGKRPDLKNIQSQEKTKSESPTDFFGPKGD